MKKITIQIIGITLLSICFGIFRYFLTDESFKLIKEKRILNSLTNEDSFNSENCDLPELFSEPMMINADFAYCLFKNGQVIFIDARDTLDYNYQHIKGSINIPYDFFEDYIYQLQEMDKETILVTYCSGGECDLSIDLADQLFFVNGFFNVLVFEEGFPIWKERGFPTN